MTRDELVERYTMWVRRCPSMRNAEIARELGMTEATFTRALTRARTAGVLSIRRRATRDFGIVSVEVCDG